MEIDAALDQFETARGVSSCAAPPFASFVLRLSALARGSSINADGRQLGDMRGCPIAGEQVGGIVAGLQGSPGFRIAAPSASPGVAEKRPRSKRATRCAPTACSADATACIAFSPASSLSGHSQTSRPASGENRLADGLRAPASK